MTILKDGQPALDRQRSGWLFVAVASSLGFLLVLVMVVITGGSDAVDAAVERGMTALRDPAVNAAAPHITTLGSLPVVVAVALGGAGVLYWRTRRFRLTGLLLTGVAVTAGTVYLLKLAVGRARPPVDGLLGQPALDYAFPSGHTTNGSVVWVLTALLLSSTLRRPGGALRAPGPRREYRCADRVVTGLPRLPLGQRCRGRLVVGHRGRRRCRLRGAMAGAVGRQPEFEAAPAVTRLDPHNIARLRTPGGSGDGQTETATALVAGPAFVEPDEPLEDPLTLRTGNLRSVVVDGYPHDSTAGIKPAAATATAQVTPPSRLTTGFPPASRWRPANPGTRARSGAEDQHARQMNRVGSAERVPRSQLSSVAAEVLAQLHQPGRRLGVLPRPLGATLIGRGQPVRTTGGGEGGGTSA